MQEDLDVVRGVFNGLFISGVMWAVLIGSYVVWFR